MKTYSTQKEILLITGTSFSSRQFCETTDGINYHQLTEKEKLELACWNGLLPEILPEVFEQHLLNKKLYLWEIKEGASFIDVELGERHLKLDEQYSIDPYSFVPLQALS